MPVPSLRAPLCSIDSPMELGLHNVIFHISTHHCEWHLAVNRQTLFYGWSLRNSYLLPLAEGCLYWARCGLSSLFIRNDIFPQLANLFHLSEGFCSPHHGATRSGGAERRTLGDEYRRFVRNGELWQLSELIVQQCAVTLHLCWPTIDAGWGLSLTHFGCEMKKLPHPPPQPAQINQRTSVQRTRVIFT